MAFAIEILLVEDNQDDAALVLRTLKNMKLDDRTAHVTDGEAAFDYLSLDNSSLLKPVDLRLVLLDIKMPRVDGFTVLDAIKKNPVTRAIPVVILTSSKQEADIQTAYKLGANAYVVKPVDYEPFIETIEALINFWIKTNCNHKV